MPAGLKLGVMDGVIGKAGDPAAVAAAKHLGLEGLQVTLGTELIADPALQRRFADQSRKHNLPIDATYIDILHKSCLKNDRQALEWIRKGIAATRAMSSGILMTVFFGKCALEPPDYDTVAGAFREVTPEAERAGVILGFENLIPAEDNARIMDKVGSPAFRIYYDAGNAANIGGFDAPKEIRFLGNRICQFHFKDKGYLGEGKVDYRAVLKAIADIGFKGYANLETSSPSGKAAADLERNIAYLRNL